jgi:hypothetical protein
MKPEHYRITLGHTTTNGAQTMDEAAPQAARGMTDGEHDLGEVSEALRALRLAWGDTYMFGHDERGYWAARHHRPGTEILRAETAEQLGSLCAADFEAKPS